MDKCKQCGENYERLARHWAMSPNCEYPEITTEQEEILTGLLMGDGTIAGTSGTPYIQIAMTNKDYLESLSSKFGNMMTQVRKSQSAEQSAEYDRNSGFNEKAKAENYSDVYVVQTRSHDKIHKFVEWYKDSVKKFPRGIVLTPTVLKHWYVCDGGFHNSKQIGISIVNERENKQKISSYFRECGLPEPINFHESSRRCKAIWSVEDSKKLIECMKPVPKGFNYKFEGDF